MTAGRPRKPKALHERDGTLRPHRHGAGNLPVEIPEMPPDLCPTAQGVWNITTRKLEAAGLVADIDQLALRMLCESVALYHEACDGIKESGLVVMTLKGNAIQNPLVGIRNKAWVQIVKLCQEFGMTPAARNGFNLPEAEEESDLDSIIGFSVN